MTLFNFFILAACTWYIAYAVTSTSGPFRVFKALREAGGGRWHGRTMGWHIEYKEQVPMHDGLLDCIVCTSVWVAIGLRLLMAISTGEIFTVNMLIEGGAAAGVALLAHAYSNVQHTF